MRKDQPWGGADYSADIHRDLKVCKRQTMEHLLAWGHRSFLPELRFCFEYKTPFSFVPSKWPVLAANGENVHFPLQLSRKWRGLVCEAVPYRSTWERCKAVHRWQSAGPGKNADRLMVTYVQKRSEKVGGNYLLDKAMLAVTSGLT